MDSPLPPEPDNDSPPPPIYLLPTDTLHHIFSLLPLRTLTLSKSLSKHFLHSLSSLHPPPLPLLSLRPSHHPLPLLHSFDPISLLWLRFPLSFLPFHSHLPITSSNGLLYLWASSTNPHLSRTLISCNPLTRTYSVLPQLGSAWSRHGSVLVGPPNTVLVLTELALLYYSKKTCNWLKFSSNLPSKPRSPIMISDNVLVLCDVGSPWRAQWKLFSIGLEDLKTVRQWRSLEKSEWGDVFDILKRPRLVKGVGDRVLMIGGLKSSFSLNSSCSTIMILRLDLGTMKWDEAGRMPVEMFRCFPESSKFKVFGGGERVCFSAKRLGKLAFWDNSKGDGVWKWIDGVPENGDGLFRGFLYEASLSATP